MGARAGEWGRLARWEQSADWPAEERLHALCFALGAGPEEVAALTRGGGRMPPGARGDAPDVGDLGEWEKRLAVVTFGPAARRDLRLLTLEAEFWQKAATDAQARPLLQTLYAFYTRALNDDGRLGEVTAYAERTLELTRQGHRSLGSWIWAIIAQADTLQKRRPAQALRAAGMLRLWTNEAATVHDQAWLCAETGLALARAGRLEALSFCRDACRMAERDGRNWELFFRRCDLTSGAGAAGPVRRGTGDAGVDQRGLLPGRRQRLPPAPTDRGVPAGPRTAGGSAHSALRRAGPDSGPPAPRSAALGVWPRRAPVRAPPAPCGILLLP